MRWHWVASWNVGFAIMSTLFYSGFQVLGTRRQCLTIFSKKNIELSKWEKVYFLQTRHFIMAKIGKASSESWANQGIYCTVKAFSCNRWITMWLRQNQKWPVKQIKTYSDPFCHNKSSKTFTGELSIKWSISVA